jgi:hypothetical protein
MRIAVDWDGTCVENVWPKKYGKWLPGAVDGLRKLLDSGWYVTVHTCRIAPVTPSSKVRTDRAVEREIRAIRRQLDEANLHDVNIHTQGYKPSADIYLDDRAHKFISWSRFLGEGDASRLDY